MNGFLRVLLATTQQSFIPNTRPIHSSSHCWFAVWSHVEIWRAPAVIADAFLRSEKWQVLANRWQQLWKRSCCCLQTPHDPPLRADRVLCHTRVSVLIYPCHGFLIQALSANPPRNQRTGVFVLARLSGIFRICFLVSSLSTHITHTFHKNHPSWSLTLTHCLQGREKKR